MSLSPRDRTYTLIGILLALFFGANDQTTVTSALPRLVEDLGGLDRYAWAATGYLLASTVMVPIYGKLADTYSRKAVELFAVSLFLFGSFLCGLAGMFGPLPLLGDGMNQLIVFRATQGLGGAGLFAMTFIIIADLYPPSVRGKYQGLVSATFAIASVLGPPVGGLLTDYGGAIIPGVEGWRWVFFVNIPFGVLALSFIALKMPTLPAPSDKAPIDITSAVLMVMGLLPFTLALQLDRARYPWLGAMTLGLFTLSLVSLWLFVRRSRGVANPIFDLNLFRNRVFVTSNVALFFLGATFLSLLIFLPLFMVNVVGVTATEAGLTLIPLSLGVTIGALSAGQLVTSLGHYKRLMLAGLSLLFVGATLLATMPDSVGYYQVVIYAAICGIGLGPSFPLYLLAVQNAVDMKRVGQATSSIQFFRQIGGAVGTTLMGVVLASAITASFESGAAQLATLLPEDPTAALEEGGLAREQLLDELDAQLGTLEAEITQALADNEQAALTALQNDPRVPAALQDALDDPGELSSNTVQTTLQEHGRQLRATLEGSLREGFSTAVTRIYRYTLILILIAVGFTVMVPELPLRTSNESEVVAVAAD